VPPSPDSPITGLLKKWREGSGTALEGVLDEAYDRLKVIARQRLHRFGGPVTLSATDLLHEALVGVVETPIQAGNRGQFFAAMSLAMRSVLVDHARARGALKRGGDRLRITLGDATLVEDERVMDMLALDEALSRLEGLDPRAAAVLHLTYFAGLDRREIAEVLETSVSTIDRSLRFSRAWLKMTLADGP
jgi:RNA polymerase sigma factor (TIGR02999 family)